jgi:hypothetical protein
MQSRMCDGDPSTRSKQRPGAKRYTLGPQKRRSSGLSSASTPAIWQCRVALTIILISPIRFIGCCSGVEDWGHLWATPTLLCCFIKIDAELAWLIAKKDGGVRYIVLLCVIIMTSSLLLPCLPVSLLTATTTIYDGYYLHRCVSKRLYTRYISGI